MAIKEYLKGIMSDADGSPSSKRWIALIAFLLIVISWGMDVFCKMPSTEYIFNALVFLVVGCLGITGIEKFSPNQ